MKLFCTLISVWMYGASLLSSAAPAVFKPGDDASGNRAEPVLVELFTSEGCSSCPPADRLLAELDHRQDIPGANVVVLSEHVDYWNQLGWRDPYSLPQWSERQSTYARQFRLESVYTPQAVIDGSRQVVGSDPGPLRRAISESAASKKMDLDITSASWNGNTLELRLSYPEADGAMLYAVIADDLDKSSVAAGENSGKRLEHVAVARVLVPLTSIREAARNEKFDVQFPNALPRQHLRVVVFIQVKNSGRILGIASREL